jgi:hypothetical protein
LTSTGFSWTLKDYAYESTPAGPINTGEMPSSVSISENEFNNFTLYPNPAQSQVSIDNLEIGSTITIFDVSGKIVYTAAANNSIAEINVSAFVSGMYFVQVANQGVLIGTQKLQVQ